MMVSQRVSRGVDLMGGLETKANRREFLRAAAVGGGAFVASVDKFARIAAFGEERKDPFYGGKQLGMIEFIGESRAPLDTVIGAGLDARLYADLSTLMPENSVTPTEKFYVRTTASELLETEKPWVLKVGGLVERSVNLMLDNLKSGVGDMGMHLMECSGNGRATRFGLISVADWAGVRISELLESQLKPRTENVMISGFDQYPTRSATSIAGADWIFPVEQLRSAKAFLATEMNGKALTKDHGAPVRLVVPGWYGCTCIKWVNAITFVDNDAEATSQMQEFAARTHQTGAPPLARDYKPASMDQAAMPIRIEKWLIDGTIKYRVVGILWGGAVPIRVLEIRFNPEEDYVRVDSFNQEANDPWSFWTHAWTPKKKGTYMIRLRVKEPQVTTKRLDSGYYMRSVEISEISE
jgi:DMSO/TMAO reductase YedYZ molybdopterin-dependent catalytic subunit